MPNQDSPVNAALKLLSFPHLVTTPVPGLPLPGLPLSGASLQGSRLRSSPQSLPVMEARLSRPLSIGKTTSLPKLSPAAALAHDARNALTSLALLSGLLAEPGVLDPNYAHLAGTLDMVTHALTELVEKFANLASDTLVHSAQLGDARLGEAKRYSATHVITAQLPEKQAKSAGEAVESCTRLLRTLAGSKVEVHVSVAKGLSPLALGEDALLRVLMNLVKNASEAMPRGGDVYITAQQALGGAIPAVLVHVADNGPGISPEAVKRIFEPGFSSKWNGSNGMAREACGLGLAIVRELVEAAGGEVEVASTRGRGTIFELRIPARD